MVLNKWIIGFKPIKYSSFWWWYRLISHQGFRFDDYHIWESFWSCLNGGWLDMNYKWEFEKFFGKGAKPEKIILPKEDYDALVERINNPEPEQIESFKRILQRKSPWDD
jgi:hypothetical protein